MNPSSPPAPRLNLTRKRRIRIRLFFLLHSLVAFLIIATYGLGRVDGLGTGQHFELEFRPADATYIVNWRTILYFSNGFLGLHSERFSPPLAFHHFNFYFWYNARSPWHWPSDYDTSTVLADNKFLTAGFYKKQYLSAGTTVATTSSLYFPLWWLALPFLLYPLRHLYRKIRRRFSGAPREFLCRNCGYDLSHSPIRCPECGETAWR